jgi:hypothetical protein
MNDNLLRLAVWSGLGIGACLLSSAMCFVAQRVWLWIGPWIMADIDRFTGIAGGLLVAAVVAVAVLARRDPSW